MPRHETPEIRALRTIALTPLGDSPLQVLFAAQSIQATAIAALDAAGALDQPGKRTASAYREPSIYHDHEFGDYQRDPHCDDLPRGQILMLDRPLRRERTRPDARLSRAWRSLFRRRSAKL